MSCHTIQFCSYPPLPLPITPRLPLRRQPQIDPGLRYGRPHRRRIPPDTLGDVAVVMPFPEHLTDHSLVFFGKPAILPAATTWRLAVNLTLFHHFRGSNLEVFGLQ